MDQNNQNNQNQPEQPVQPPVNTEHHDAVSTVMQPRDAQPVTLPTETPAQAAEATPAPTEPVMAQTTAPDAPAAESTHQQAQVATTPTGNQAQKNPMLMIVGVFVVVMLLAGGVVYVMGRANQTQRLGVEDRKSLPVNPVQPSPTQVLLPEEQELNAIDVANPETELNELDSQLDTLQ